MSEYNTMDPEKIKAKFDVKMSPYPHSEAGVEVCYVMLVRCTCAVLCCAYGGDRPMGVSCDL
jgi:hypothetical protein